MTLGVTVIDGGLSTALEEVGADIGGPLWTARVVIESPGLLVEAHRRFVEAGAAIVTTASYQCGVREFERAGLDASTARRTLTSTVDLARRATEGTTARVAASVGPFGAVLADGSEYTGRYVASWGDVEKYHRDKLEVLVGAGADLIAVETIPRADEARLIAGILDDLGAPAAWFSFGARSSRATYGGDDLRTAVTGIAGYANLVAVGVNCTHPSLVGSLLRDVGSVAHLPLVAYPNHGADWDAVGKCWRGVADGTDLPQYLDEWLAAGARLVGGCCGVGTRGVAAIAAARARH